jgi:hypothetical protein
LEAALFSGSKWKFLIDVWIFPARVVHCVTFYFWFFDKKGTHGGSTGFSGLILACNINILLHLGFAVLGVSYWEFCGKLGALFRFNDPIAAYLFINICIGIWLSLLLLRTKECIDKMQFMLTTWQRKFISLVAFIIFVPGFVVLNYQVAMWTLKAWY